jgi:hypothetical protein
MRLMRRLIVVVKVVTALACASTMPKRNADKLGHVRGATNMRRKKLPTIAAADLHG